MERYPHTREIHKTTGQVVYKVRRTGGRERYDTVTYIGQNESGSRVEIPAAEYGKFLPAYRVGDIIENHPNFQTTITGLTRKSKNVALVEYTLTYTKTVGVNDAGSTKVWTEELPGRIT